MASHSGGAFGNRSDVKSFAARAGVTHMRIDCTSKSAGNNWGYSIFELRVPDCGTNDDGGDGGGGGDASCGDGQHNGDETGVDCGGACLPCGFPGNKSDKRGMAYHFCGWSISGGQAQLDQLKGGSSWYYNWGVAPKSEAECGFDGKSVANSPDINRAARPRPGSTSSTSATRAAWPWSARP
ncbi:hypothetical protein Hoch_1819 [Haliangium ochraceum DSM 14365]|uniref:Uncharacterized protein n=1 Tax=Haliangium ochraceum (strain DSM 14365 / JCM 11303 / SMP-2) TaxID=502025 RepID=D0LY12_HALO1|nr:hypothetical protein Hoch_1819 [Haliangium ochraceum DSM 14365]